MGFIANTNLARKQARDSRSKWGGGSLFTFTTQSQSKYRGLKREVEVPTFDLSQFIADNFHESDEVILKIDIEGAEYSVIDKMLTDGTFKYVDNFFLEFHDWRPTGWSQKQKDDLRARMETSGVFYEQWDAEYPKVPAGIEWNPKIFGQLQKVES